MKKIILYLLFSCISLSLWAQDIKPKRQIDFFLDVLGLKGLLAVLGIIIFAYTYKNSIRIFSWIDEQT